MIMNTNQKVISTVVISVFSVVPLFCSILEISVISKKGGIEAPLKLYMRGEDYEGKSISKLKTEEDIDVVLEKYFSLFGQFKAGDLDQGIGPDNNVDAFGKIGGDTPEGEIHIDQVLRCGGSALVLLGKSGTTTSMTFAPMVLEEGEWIFGANRFFENKTLLWMLTIFRNHGHVLEIFENTETQEIPNVAQSLIGSDLVGFVLDECNGGLPAFGSLRLTALESKDSASAVKFTKMIESFSRLLDKQDQNEDIVESEFFEFWCESDGGAVRRSLAGDRNIPGDYIVQKLKTATRKGEILGIAQFQKFDVLFYQSGGAEVFPFFYRKNPESSVFCRTTVAEKTNQSIVSIFESEVLLNAVLNQKLKGKLFQIR